MEEDIKAWISNLNSGRPNEIDIRKYRSEVKTINDKLIVLLKEGNNLHHIYVHDETEDIHKVQHLLSTQIENLASRYKLELQLKVDNASNDLKYRSKKCRLRYEDLTK